MQSKNEAAMQTLTAFDAVIQVFGGKYSNERVVAMVECKHDIKLFDYLLIFFIKLVKI